MTATSTSPGSARPRAPDRARFRPGLLTAAYIAGWPAAAVAGPDGRPDVTILVVGAVFVTLALVVDRLGHRRSPRARDVMRFLIAMAALVYFIALARRTSVPTGAFLGLAAALAVSLAAIRRRRVRWYGQTIALAATAVLLLRDVHTDASGLDLVMTVAGPVLVLAAICVLASTLAGDLDVARRRDRSAREEADRRAALLDTVRTLGRAGPGRRVDTAVEVLVGLGFDVVAVAVLDGDDLVPQRVVGLDWSTPVDARGGVVAHTLTAEHLTVGHDLAFLPDVDDVTFETLWFAAIPRDGRPYGLLIAGRTVAGAARRDGSRDPHAGDADAEAVEVLAAQLAAMLAAEDRVANQDALLLRLRELDAMRGGFVSRVSEDLRDPLTVVRGVAQLLAAYGDQLDEPRRHELLSRLRRHSVELASTLETLLDFSRSRHVQSDGVLEATDVVELLAPALAGGRVQVEVRERGSVDVDRQLVRRAVELLRSSGLERGGIVIEQDGDALVLRLRSSRAGGFEEGLALSVAEQLLVAAGAHYEALNGTVLVRLPLSRSPVGR